ncbi:M48 family metalloprotease [Candidatus Woesearchaeota archaeon]|nr:M48 family metalloprotease [Candidatus Woesearchaeota archaeon]
MAAINYRLANQDSYSGLEQRTLLGARQESALFWQIYNRLPDAHPTSAQINTILRDLLKAAKQPENKLNAYVYEGEHPDAHISPLTKEVRISSKLLEVMDYRTELVASVIAHEVGHLLLEHYNDRTLSDIKSDAGFDPLKSHTIGYEEEYTADKASLILTRRIGLRGGLLSESLTRIDDFYRGFDFNAEVTDESLEIPRGERESQLMWILNTHPYITRRKISLAELERRMPDNIISPNYELEITPPATQDFRGKTEELHGIGRRGMPLYTFFDFDHPLYNLDLIWESKKPDDYKFAPNLVSPSSIINAEHDEHPFLDLTPEEVNSLFSNSLEDIVHWWDQALFVVNSQDGYSDFLNEIGQYSLNSIRLLMENLPIMRYLSISDEKTVRHDAETEMDLELSIINGVSIFPSQLYAVSSLLINKLYSLSQQSDEQFLRQMLDFFRDFRLKNGAFFPYGQGLILDIAKSVFANADDNQRWEYARLFKNYEDELQAGPLGQFELAQYFFKDANQWLKERSDGTDLLFCGSKYKTRTSLDEHADKLIKSASADEIREFLKSEVPWNFSLGNWTRYLISSIEGLEGTEEHDRVREANPRVAAKLMTEDEFQNEFFGASRNKHRRASYTFLDKGISLYSKIHTLWRRSGFKDEYKAMPAGLEKVLFLADTLHIASSERDQMISKALGWRKLKYLDDIDKVQKEIYETENIELLLTLSELFSHPLLALAASQRLWELGSGKPEGMLRIMPSRYIHKVDTKLKGLEHLAIVDAKFKYLLACYPNPSYLRDELLRPFIDRAPDETSTNAIASFLLEPPPVVMAPREGSIVALTETLLDALSGLSTLDKEEVLMYLLGHKTFYSAIDSLFPSFSEKKGLFDRNRALCLYEADKIPKTDSANFDGRYLVSRPDAVVMLSKYSGIPIDLIFKQQRVATTRREQRDLLYYTLLGDDGILLKGNGHNFLKAAAKTVVYTGGFLHDSAEKDKEAITELLAHALDKCPRYKLADLFLDIWLLKEERNVSLPELVARLMQRYGSVLIKAGQYLANQTAVLPLEWTRAFRSLSDQNSVGDKTLLYEYAALTYGNNLPFESLGRKIAEGSMAVVYEGTLHDGTKVAVKAIHPHILRELDDDIKFLDSIVNFINSKRDKYGVSLPINLGEVTRKYIQEEADIRTEIRNNHKLRWAMSKGAEGVDFHLVKPFENISKGNFLVTKYVEGTSIDKDNDLRNLGLEGRIVRNSVGIEIYRQILGQGFYQADPNMGNFLADAQASGKPVVYWLDTGNLGYLTQRDRSILKSFIRSLAISDINRMTSALTQIIHYNSDDNSDGNGDDKQQITRKTSLWLRNQLSTDSLSFENLDVMFNEFLDLCAQNKWVLKEQWVTLLRTLGLTKPLMQDADTLQVKLDLARHIIF